MYPVYLKRIVAVFSKDTQSELRTRYSISAILLFILTTITMIAISSANEKLTTGISAGILWIIMFFAAMTGIAKAFVSEEERGTGFLLKIYTSNDAVYFGKLLFNILLCLLLNITATLIYLLINGSIVVRQPFIFIFMLILGSLGMASGTTLISAIIARANVKGALFPVLSFPVILPLIISGISLTKLSFEGGSIADARSDMLLMLAYSGVIIPVSYILFDQIWEE
jgi:heme exporter protein B